MPIARMNRKQLEGAMPTFEEIEEITALDLVENADTRFGLYRKLAASDDFRFIRRS
jgi:hypothetical protein